MNQITPTEMSRIREDRTDIWSSLALWNCAGGHPVFLSKEGENPVQPASGPTHWIGDLQVVEVIALLAAIVFVVLHLAHLWP